MLEWSCLIQWKCWAKQAVSSPPLGLNLIRAQLKASCMPVTRVCEELRVINSEGQVDQRTSFIVEELFRVRRKGFAQEGAACLLLQSMAADTARSPPVMRCCFMR